MKTAIAFVLLLAVAGMQRAAAWEGCVDEVTGESSPVGTGCPNAVCVDHTKGARAKGMITKVNIYEADGCIVGVKPTYGFDARNAALIGKEKGSGKHIKLSKGEFITKMETTANGCIKYLKLSTNKGNSVMLGTAGAVSTASAPAGSYLYAFKGCTGVAGCSVHLTNLVAVWAKDVCKPPTAALPVASPVPSPEVEEPVVTPPVVEASPVPVVEASPVPVVETVVPPAVVEVAVPPPAVVEVAVPSPPVTVEVSSPAVTPLPAVSGSPAPSGVCEEGDLVEGSFPYTCVSSDSKVGVMAIRGFFGKTFSTSHKCFVKACPATPSPSPSPAPAKGSKGIVISFGKGRKLQGMSKGITFAAPAPKVCFDWCKPKPKAVVITKPTFTMKSKGL